MAKVQQREVVGSKLKTKGKRKRNPDCCCLKVGAREDGRDILSVGGALKFSPPSQPDRQLTLHRPRVTEPFSGRQPELRGPDLSPALITPPHPPPQVLPLPSVFPRGLQSKVSLPPAPNWFPLALSPAFSLKKNTSQQLWSGVHSGLYGHGEACEGSGWLAGDCPFDLSRE